MAVKTTFRWRGDPRPGIRRATTQAARGDTNRRAQNVLAAARSNLRARSRTDRGEISRTLGISSSESAQGPSARIGSDDPRALYVEEGTGVYGPRKRPVVPRNRKWMKFRSSSGSTVFAQQTLGQPGKHYLRDAASAARD